MFIEKPGGSNANTSSWGATQTPQQQWDQPSGSNAAVNVNAANANVGQNATMWPSAAGTNPGKLYKHKRTRTLVEYACTRAPRLIKCFTPSISGSQQAHEQIQSASKAQGQTQQPQQASTQQPQPQQAAGR